MKQEFSPYFVIYMDLSLGFVTWICHLDLSQLNPIRPGGGGSEARMVKLTAANQKPLIL